MKSIEHLFEEHEKVLVTFSASIIQNYEDARDVVQQVFLECFEKKIEVEKPYLFKAVRNRSLNRIRSTNRFSLYMNRFLEYCEAIFSIDTQSNDSSIWEILSILPAKQKEVVLLRIKGDLKISEIAQILNLPEGTVKSRLNKAFGTLRSKYSGEKR